jgi:hypothetical protein
MQKPIISIDVDASKFEAFYKLFSEYQGKLEEQPGAWDALNDAMAGTGDALKHGAASGEEALSKAAGEAERVVIHLRQATTQQGLFSKATASHTRGFADLGRAGSGAWKAIGGAADASIAKTGAGLMDMVKGIAPIAGEAVAAVLGPIGIAIGASAAAIAGLKALADAGIDRQRSAFGLGMTPGQTSSFQVYGNQFLGTGALQAAANAQRTYGSSGQLGTLGIDWNTASKMTPGDLAVEMLRKTAAIAKAQGGPLGMVPAVMQYQALGGDINDVQNAITMGPAALNAAQRNIDAKANLSRMALDKNAVNSGAALSQALNAAGVAGQSLGINKLSGADPTIAKAINFLTGGPNATRDKVANALAGGPAGVAHALLSVGTTAVHNTVPALHALASAAQSVTRSFTQPIAGTAAAASIIGVANKKGIDPKLALALAMQEGGGVIQPHGMGDYGRFDKSGNFIPMNAGAKGGHYTSFGAYQLHESGELGNLTMQQAFDVATNAGVSLSEVASVLHSSPSALAARERMLGVGSWGSDVSKLSPGQIGALAQRPADAAGYAKSMDAYYRQVRNTRPPQITVKVTNPTQSRVAVSINAAALSSQF